MRAVAKGAEAQVHPSGEREKEKDTASGTASSLGRCLSAVLVLKIQMSHLSARSVDLMEVINYLMSDFVKRRVSEGSGYRRRDLCHLVSIEQESN